MFVTTNYIALFVLAASTCGSPLPQTTDRTMGGSKISGTELPETRITKSQEIPAPKVPIQHFYCGTTNPIGFYSGLLDGIQVPMYHLNTTAEQLASEGFEIKVGSMLHDAIYSFTASNSSFALGYGFTGYSGVAAAGGKPASRTRAFYMAQLGTRRNDEIVWLCDGTLINQEWILTAAHCFLMHGQEPDLVRLGDYDLNEPKEQNLSVFGKFVYDYPMADVVLHPEFKLRERYHDIALVRIPRKYPKYSSSINPACLPWGSLTNKDLVGKQLTLTGWGATNYGGPKTPLLQEVELEVFPTTICDQNYFGLKDFHQKYPQGMDEDTVLCVGSHTEGKDACGGDSGAPVVYTVNDTFIIAGIVSGGFGCGLKKFPGLYIPINKPKYLQWIKDVAFKEYI